MIYRHPREEIAALVEGGGRGLPPAVPVRSDIRLLLDCTRAGKLRDYLILRLLYASGIRRQELADLRVADCCWESATLFVRASKKMKDRYVLVDRETMRLLCDWVGQAPPERLVFESSEHNISRVFRYWAEKSGLYPKYIAQGRSLAPHAFRHAFATHAYENGLDFYIINRLLGHTFGETTAIYTRTARRQLDAAYDRSHPFAWHDELDRIPNEREHCQDELDGGQSEAGRDPDEHGQGTEEWPDRQEFHQEFACQLKQVSMGYFLPIVPFRSEMAELLSRAAGPLALVLRAGYATGMHLDQVVNLQPDDLLPEQRCLRAGSRSLRVDEETLTKLTIALPFSLAPAEAAASLLGLAREWGVTRRFAAAGREFTPEAVRFAYAVHSAERGIDRISLMNQLGHHYLQTTATFCTAAAGQYRAEFDRYQEFASGGP